MANLDGFVYIGSMTRVAIIFVAVAIFAACAQAHTLVSVDAMGTNATVGAGGFLYQGCELCTAGNRIVAVPTAGAGIMLFDALATGVVTNEEEATGDIVTSLATEIPDINQLVCGTTIAMAVGVSGTDLKVHFVFFNVTADALSSVDIVFDNTVNGVASNHVVASAKSTNSFMACGTESAAGVWRCALFDVAADGSSITRYNFEGIYDNTGFVLPGISFDGLKMVLLDLTEGGVQAFDRMKTHCAPPDTAGACNFTKVGHTSIAGQDAFVTSIAGTGSVVKRLQYHRKSLSFIGMYEPDNVSGAQLFAIRLSANPGHQTVVDVEIGDDYWGNAATDTEVPSDFYINRYGNDVIGIYHDGANPVLSSLLVLDHGHAGLDFDSAGPSLTEAEGFRRIVEMCPILGTDAFVWATAVADNDITAFTYGGGYFASPTINSLVSGTAVKDLLTADPDILVKGSIVVNWTISEPGTNDRTRISFIPMDLDENHADSYDVVKWVEITTATANTYSVTLDFDDISAVNPEALAVVASSTLNNITSGSWLVRVRVLHTAFDHRSSIEQLIIVVDESAHTITNASSAPGIGRFDMNNEVVDASKITATCQSADGTRLYVVEVGQGVHEYAINKSVTHRKDVFTFTRTMAIALAFTDADCAYEDDVILFASKDAIHAYIFNAVSGLLDVHHTAALDLTALPITMDGGFTVHRVSATIVSIFFYSYTAPTTHPTRAFLIDQEFNPTTGAFVNTALVTSYDGFTPGIPSLFIDTESDSSIVREILVNDTASKTLLSFSYVSSALKRQAHADLVPGFKRQTRFLHSDHSGTFANDVASINGGLSSIAAHNGADTCGHNGVFDASCDPDADLHLGVFSVGNLGKIFLYQDKAVIYEIKPTPTTGAIVDHWQPIRTIYFLATTNPATAAATDTMDCACVCSYPLLAFHRSHKKHPKLCVGNSCTIFLTNGALTVVAHEKTNSTAQFIATHVSCHSGGLIRGDRSIVSVNACKTNAWKSFPAKDFTATCGNVFEVDLDSDATLDIGLGLGESKDTLFRTRENLIALSKTTIVASATGSTNITATAGSFGHGTGNLYLAGDDGYMYFGGSVANYYDLAPSDQDFFAKYVGMILVLASVGLMAVGAAMTLKAGKDNGYGGGY